MKKKPEQPEQQESEIMEDAQPQPELQLEESKEQQREQSYLEDLQRVQAEFENYMKRVEKERIMLTDFAKRELLLKMLALQDEFEMALESMKNADDKGEILKGVEMLHHHLQKILESEHVRKVEALGKQADPYYHEVITQIEGEEGMVVEEVKKGYMVKDKLLRASMVKVGNKGYQRLPYQPPATTNEPSGTTNPVQSTEESEGGENV